MRTIVCWVAGLAVLAACSGGEPLASSFSAEVARVDVVPASATVGRGRTLQLNAVLRDASGATLPDRPVSWISMDPAVAQVSPSGVVTGMGVGHTTIRATLNGIAGEASTDVITTTVAALRVAPPSMLATVGSTTQFTATATDGNGAVLTGRPVVWTSSNPAVATISAEGLVSSVGPGSTTIQATCEGLSASTTLTVIEPPVGGLVPLLFASDFSSALGNSTLAISDGAKPIHWNDIHPDADQLYVVSAAGLGFPSGITNVMRTRYMGVNSADVKSLNQWPEPATGGSLYFRIYYRLDIPNSYGNLASGGHHPIEPVPGSCPFEWEFRIGSNADGTMDWKVTTPGADYRMILNKFQTYRFEWAFKNRTSTGGYSFEIRVFDASNAIVGWNGTFIRMNTNVSLAADNPTLTMSAACIRALTVGSNGPSGWENVGTTVADAFSYHSGTAVSQAGWIGPYVPGEHP